MSLTPEQRALLPDDSDVAFYEANGYYISKEGVLPEALIDSACEGTERFYRGERDGTLPFDTGFSNWKPGDGDGQRNNEFVSLQNSELKALAVHPLLGAIAAKLTGSSAIRVLDDQLIYKPSNVENASSTATGWHADRAYWATCSSDKMISVWIPLHSVDITRSPLVVMAGSHRCTDLEDVRVVQRHELREIVERYRAHRTAVLLLPMP